MLTAKVCKTKYAKIEFQEHLIFITLTTNSIFFIFLQIEEGEIYAMINQKDGMVVFLDSPEKYASPETLCVLEQQMAACTKLHQYIQEMDEQIQVNPQVCCPTAPMIDGQA